MAEGGMGFIPNSLLIMARWPELLKSALPLMATVLSTGEVDQGLKQMMAAVISKAAGCRYCQAHTTHGAAEKAGVAEEKIARVWEYQMCDLFTDAERAALDLALVAGQNPNGATDAEFTALRKHYSERQIIEMVGVISTFGFLNRWNDTLATDLEAKPLAFASDILTPARWDVGKHGGNQ